MKSFLWILSALFMTIPTISGHPEPTNNQGRTQNSITPVRPHSPRLPYDGMADTVLQKSNTDSLDCKHMELTGDYYREKLNLAKALYWYEKAFTISNDKQVSRKIAECYYKRGYYRKCIDLLLAGPVTDSLPADFKLLGKCYEQINVVDSALICQKIVAEKNTYDYTNIISLANNYLNLQLPDSALYYTLKYNINDSTNLLVNQIQALAYYKKGDYPNALSQYKKLRSMNDNSVSSDYYMGLSYIRADSLNQGYDCLMAASEKAQGNNPYILSELGVAATKIGFIEEGIVNIRKAIELLQPDNTLMHYLYNAIAIAYMEKRDSDNCIIYLKKSLEYNSGSLMTLYRIAYAYHMKKDMENEKKYYLRFIKEAGKRNDLNETMISLKEAAEKRLEEIKVENFFSN